MSKNTFYAILRYFSYGFFLLSVTPFFASIFIHKKVDTPFNDQPFMRGTTKNQNKVGTYLWDTLYYKYFIFPYHKYKCSVIMLCKQLNYAFIMDVGIYWYDTDEDCGYLHCIIKCIFYSAHKTLRQIQKRPLWMQWYNSLRCNQMQKKSVWCQWNAMTVDIKNQIRDKWQETDTWTH